MITHQQKRILLAIASIVCVWMAVTKMKHQADVSHRAAVASVFLGDKLAADYIRLDLGNCEFVIDRRARFHSSFEKRKTGDIENCETIVSKRQEALLLRLGSNPTSKECFDYVRPKLETSMTDNAIMSACQYFLEYDYG